MKKQAAKYEIEEDEEENVEGKLHKNFGCMTGFIPSFDTRKIIHNKKMELGFKSKSTRKSFFSSASIKFRRSSSKHSSASHDFNAVQPVEGIHRSSIDTALDSVAYPNPSEGDLVSVSSPKSLPPSSPARIAPLHEGQHDNKIHKDFHIPPNDAQGLSVENTSAQTDITDICCQSSSQTTLNNGEVPPASSRVSYNISDKIEDGRGSRSPNLFFRLMGLPDFDSNDDDDNEEEEEDRRISTLADNNESQCSSSTTSTNDKPLSPNRHIAPLHEKGSPTLSIEDNINQVAHKNIDNSCDTSEDSASSVLDKIQEKPAKDLESLKKSLEAVQKKSQERSMKQQTNVPISASLNNEEEPHSKILNEAKILLLQTKLAKSCEDCHSNSKDRNVENDEPSSSSLVDCFERKKESLLQQRNVNKSLESSNTDTSSSLNASDTKSNSPCSKRLSGKRGQPTGMSLTRKNSFLTRSSSMPSSPTSPRLLSPTSPTLLSTSPRLYDSNIANRTRSSRDQQKQRQKDSDSSSSSSKDKDKEHVKGKNVKDMTLRSSGKKNNSVIKQGEAKSEQKSSISKKNPKLTQKPSEKSIKEKREEGHKEIYQSVPVSKNIVEDPTLKCDLVHSDSNSTSASSNHIHSKDSESASACSNNSNSTDSECPTASSDNKHFSGKILKEKVASSPSMKHNVFLQYITRKHGEPENKRPSLVIPSPNDTKHAKEIDVHENSPEYSYIQDILAGSGLLKSDNEIVLHSLGWVIDPHLFFKLEKKYSAMNTETLEKSKVRKKCQREVVFHVVNEILCMKLTPYLILPWTCLKDSFNQRRPYGKNLVMYVWKEYQRLQPCPKPDLRETTSIILEKDLAATWRNQNAEYTPSVARIVADVEKMIFNDLVSEICNEL